MADAALFVSDLHLPATASPLREAFLRFLGNEARGGTSLYILGDLFEYWIGDDAGLEAHAAEVAALRAVRDAGVKTYFLHGNRDFLVGRRFARAAGLELLPDPVVMDLHGRRTLLLHGDLLCTDDVRYQRWRRISRSLPVRGLFLAMPRSRREKIAGGVRNATTADMRNKPAAILDVNAEAVTAAFRAHGVDRMIHGHTHRPDEHRHEVDGRSCERIVLADWRPERIEALRVTAERCERIALA